MSVTDWLLARAVTISSARLAKHERRDAAHRVQQPQDAGADALLRRPTTGTSRGVGRAGEVVQECAPRPPRGPGKADQQRSRDTTPRTRRVDVAAPAAHG